MKGQHRDRQRISEGRRRIAAFLGALAVTIAVSAFVSQQAANAFSIDWRHGGATVNCVTRYYSYPQYGISGVITKCGPYYHASGPVQS